MSAKNKIRTPSVRTSVYWKLIFSHMEVEEALGESSVREYALLNPTAMQILDVDGRPIVQIPLREDGIIYKPVFYRQKSIDPETNMVKLHWVVFGRGYQKGSTIDGQLWTIDAAGRVVNAPQYMIAKGAIMNCLS